MYLRSYDLLNAQAFRFGVLLGDAVDDNFQPLEGRETNQIALKLTVDAPLSRTAESETICTV